MRLLLVGAFPYPHHQGSQVYLQEQAVALRRAGAEVELMTYASAAPSQDDPDRWRALDGFVLRRAPDWSAPRSFAAGPSWEKLPADLGVATKLYDAIVSKKSSPSHFDAILTHNAEACVIALGLRALFPNRFPPIVYCVHTILEHELSAYFQTTDLENKNFLHRARSAVGQHFRRGLDQIGRGLDYGLARGSDGWICLTHSSERVMRQASRAPGVRIPPPLPDPTLEPRALREVLERHALTLRGFLLYSGNRDAYQELELLGRAAARARARRTGQARLEIVAASHDAAVLAPGALPDGLRPAHVASSAQMQALIAGARATVVMRRAPGGFPIKLANSLACGTPPIVYLGEEWGLRDGVDAQVADPARPVESLADAILALERDPARAERLGQGARRRYERAHRPADAANAALTLVARIRATGPRN